MTVIHVVKQLTMYLIILINEKNLDKEVSILKIPKSNLKGDSHINDIKMIIKEKKLNNLMML